MGTAQYSVLSTPEEFHELLNDSNNMAIKLLVSLVIVAVASADVGSHVSVSHGGKPAVTYGAHRPHHAPAYHPAPAYHHRPRYHHQPAPYKPAPAYKYEPEIPACSANTTKTWSLEDNEYPTYELKAAIEYHFKSFKNLYADVAELNTELSVERPTTLEEETYLCPSETAYIRPLRAVNTEGKWRIVVNNVDAHYQTLTQTTRIEECLTSGDACPLVPECYESKCLQKSIYHRFLVYDAYDQYFPFAIETFKLPAACACYNGDYVEPPHRK